MSSWPCGHGAGSSARAIGRLTSNVLPHARHLTSYLGTVPSSSRCRRPARAIVRPATDTGRRAPHQPPTPEQRPAVPGASGRGRPRDAARPRRRRARAARGRRLAGPPRGGCGGDEELPLPRLPPADPACHAARRHLARGPARRLRRPRRPPPLAHALLVGALAPPLTHRACRLIPGFSPDSRTTRRRLVRLSSEKPVFGGDVGAPSPRDAVVLRLFPGKPQNADAGPVGPASGWS